LKRLYHKVHFFVRAYRRLEIMNKAASLSFYTIISVFPMMLILAALSSYFFSQAVMVEILSDFVKETLPYQSDLIMQNLTALFVKKKVFSWFGVGALIVSAQILYVNFEKIVNGLLHTSKQRHFLMTRLFFIFWIMGVVFVLFAPVIFELIASWFLTFGIDLRPLSRFFVRGGFVLVGFLVFTVVMLILPTKRVHFKRLFTAGLCFALTLQLGKIIFKWFTYRNFDRYNLIYGSLSSMVLVILWIFYFYNMFLFFVYWVGRDRDPQYAQHHGKA